MAHCRAGDLWNILFSLASIRLFHLTHGLFDLSYLFNLCCFLSTHFHHVHPTLYFFFF